MPAAIPKGHVYLARKILTSSLWGKLPTIRVVAITSIVNANHEDGVTCPDGRRDIEVKRGQFVRCWKRFSDDCGLLIQSTRTAIENLEAAHFIKRESYPKYSLYTVQKYEEHQSRDQYGRERKMPGGYIMIARRIVDSSLWELDPVDRVVAITCLLVAAFQDGMYADGTKETPVPRGSFVSTPEKLAKSCRLDVALVAKALNSLADIKFLQQEAMDGLNIVKVENYSFYQDASNYQISRVGRKTHPEAVGGEIVTPATLEVACLEEDLANTKVTRSQQDVNKTSTRSQQDVNKTSTRNKNVVKNAEEEREGGEGGEGAAPPPPSLSQNLDLWGAPPPLPPDEQIATEYRRKFDCVMSFEKARKQAVLFLRKGGKLHDALAAIQAAPEIPAVPIWKILDPLLIQGPAPRPVKSVSQQWLEEQGELK